MELPTLASRRDSPVAAMEVTMQSQDQVRRHGLAKTVVAGNAATLAACATGPQLDAQWTDPAAAPNLLHGARELVACDAADIAVRQVCQDPLASEVVARGATPVFVPPETPIATDRSVDAQLLPAARQAGATAMVVM